MVGEVAAAFQPNRMERSAGKRSREQGVIYRIRSITLSDDFPPDLSLLARQQRQLLSEMGSIRDDLAVLTVVAMRQDGTLSALLAEVPAMYSQHSRLDNRVRQIESRHDV